MTQPATYPDVVRVRLPAETHKALRANGKVSTQIRQAVDLYLSHPAMKSNPTPKTTSEKASAS